jgi:DNA-binding FadR family transcriptional regulator
VAGKTKKTARRVLRSEGTTLHATLAATLGAEILSGRRKPGERIPSVEEMNTRFGVSRVVVREVVKTLTAKGLVVSKTKIGTIVREAAAWNWLDAEVLEWRVRAGLDNDFLEQITAVRQAIEPEGAALAARNRSKDDIAALRRCLQAMRAAEGDITRFSEADLAYHLAIGAASGNPLVRSFGAVIKVALKGFMAMSNASVKQAEKGHAGSTDRHAAILAAIEARDEGRARAAMLRVIEGGRTHAGRKLRVKSR